MFLKAMELFGFKSFAEKVIINFSGGISAIIGPNGCGKSNIVDAVRWALGEQSAKTLRGGRMEDIIFSGSEKRKPLNFAEVTLVFGDVNKALSIDYDELSITRRIYRSGESEYLINKASCRLKDVAELFMDTGIGKEVYSIVGQNRVEEIIFAKPEERRELIEEAAGILKYKHRKKEARKRLEDMRGNLQRITDLIFEMENQIKPLKGQAEIARQYKKLKDEIKDNEKQIISHRININENMIKKETAKLTSLRDESFKDINLLHAVSAKVDEVLKEIDRLNSEKIILERTLNGFMREKEQLEGKKTLAEERERNIREQMESNANSIKDLQRRFAEIKELQKNIDENLKTREIIIEDLIKLIEELKQKDYRYKNDDSLLLIERIRDEYTAAVAESKVLESDLLSRKNELDDITMQIESRKSQIAEEEKKLGNCEVKGAELEEQRTAKEGHLKGLGIEIENHSLMLQKISADLKSLKEEDLSLKEKLHSAENKRWLLKKLEKETNSLQSGSAELLREENLIKGIVCSFFSVVNVPLEYRPAIETALGEKYFGIIASDSDAALEAINYLNDKGKGRASIFPLSLMEKIKKKGIINNDIDTEKFKEIPGFIQSAFSLVKADSPYGFIAEIILKNIFVCEDLSSALIVAEAADYEVCVVTIQGETVYPNGIIRGGKSGKDMLSHWNREEEMKELEAVTADYKNELNIIENDLRKLGLREKELSQKEKELINLERQLSSGLDLITRDFFLNEKEKEHLEKGISELKMLEESGRKKKAEKERALMEAKEKTEKSVTDRNLLAQRLNELKEKNEHLLKDKEANREQINREKISLNITREQISAIKNQKEQFEAEISSIETSVSRLQEKNKELDKQLFEVFEDKKTELTRTEMLASKTSEVSLAYERVEAKYFDFEVKRTGLEKEIQDLKNKRNRSEKQEHRLDISITRLTAEKEHQTELFSDKFGYLPVPGDVSADFDEAAFSDKIEALKKEAYNMGHVRVGAIDELERLTDRVNFLREQEEDLNNGEKSLIGILEEIDNRIKEQFIEAAEEIKANFSESFLDIFGGGKAMIRFTDEDKILESGIEIDVQPPGKNLKNISLLSSGEKALTAIAFIFAIFKYKPAPFYFLDEIESSLDDSNLTRFIEYLEKGAFDSQFILITHRRKTMEKAGLVYGVTMPESGVSKIISIKLDKKAS